MTDFSSELTQGVEFNSTTGSHDLVFGTRKCAAACFTFQSIPDPVVPDLPFYLILGDVNRDGRVNFLDISPFITLVSSGGFNRGNVFVHEADVNQDSRVNFLDIAPFIQLLG